MTPVVRLRGVGLRREGRGILTGVDWDVHPGAAWVVIGANGSGKTTLGRIASLWEHPSEGRLEWQGEPLGTFDVRTARRRVSFVSAAMADMVRPALPAVDVVMCAKHAALEPWWHEWHDADRERAASLLDDVGIGDLAHRPFGRLSSGERQRTLLARALMPQPDLVVLDEPAAGLDLGGREELVDRLAATAEAPGGPAVVLVTHHVEEVPPGFTHLLALRRGRVLAAGELAATLTEDLLEECFGVPVRLRRHDTRSGIRYSAVSA